jgi:nicotinate-nucleotide adenylyltransferase
MLRIGILGGTFNPVHVGHTAMAEDALAGFELSQVMFIPCANPPHKEAPELVSAEDRLAMLRIVSEKNERFVVSDMEIVRGGVSYSIQTVKELTVQLSGAKLIFLTGTDSLCELHMWKDVEELLSLCEFKTFERPGYPASAITIESLQLKEGVSKQLLAGIVAGHPVDVSSSDVRCRVAEGGTLEGLVDPGVEEYIREKELYAVRGMR